MFKRSKKAFPIGSDNLFFKRTTSRYARKGTFSSNRGYMRVMRDLKTGQFTSIS